MLNPRIKLSVLLMTVVGCVVDKTNLSAGAGTPDREGRKRHHRRRRPPARPAPRDVPRRPVRPRHPHQLGVRPRRRHTREGGHSGRHRPDGHARRTRCHRPHRCHGRGRRDWRPRRSITSDNLQRSGRAVCRWRYSHHDTDEHRLCVQRRARANWADGSACKRRPDHGPRDGQPSCRAHSGPRSLGCQRWWRDAERDQGPLPRGPLQRHQSWSRVPPGLRLRETPRRDE